MAKLCLGSLVRHVTDRLELVIHDDGTLTPEDVAELRAELGPFALVTRAEADERVSEALASRPSTRRFRERNPLALKLVDFAALSEREVICGVDSDVLALRPCSGLFDLQSSADALFMEDVQNAYGIRSWQLLVERRLLLWQRINSGIFAIRAALYDPELLEWFLGHPRFDKTPVWSEQTAWALMAGRGRCRTLDHRLVTFPDRPWASDAAVLHFVEPLRRHLDDVARRAAGRDETESVTIRSVAARRLTWRALLASEIVRRLSRGAAR
ncbi:MAG TPA: hypothetical protein VMT85_01090 [Thermoanaerobaculia bacterium]|nr:hypothetical protein [Thermoanaerobaculia bacterium]